MLFIMFTLLLVTFVAVEWPGGRLFSFQRKFYAVKVNNLVIGATG